MISAGAALPFYNEPAMAQLSAVRDMPADAVKINANENPLGPCPEALEAIHNIAAKGGRYLYEETFGFQEVLAEQEGVKANYVQAYPRSGAPMCSDLVAKDKDIIILRTFSKIYGMAGIRAGAAIGRPDLLKKLGNYSTGALPVTGMAAGTASLKSKTVIPQRRKIIGDVRNDVQAFLEKHNFKYVPSVSNKFMVDVKRPGGEIIAALQKEKIYIGRVWPSWPTYVRVSIGTQAEMDKFKTAFLKVMA